MYSAGHDELGGAAVESAALTTRRLSLALIARWTCTIDDFMIAEDDAPINLSRQLPTGLLTCFSLDIEAATCRLTSLEASAPLVARLSTRGLPL